MKTYKDFPRVFIGYSDRSDLVLRSYSEVKFLGFDHEDNYFAWFVNEPIEIDKIGGAFRNVMTCRSTLWVYDDERRTAAFDAPEIRVYIDNDDNCIIYAPGGVQTE